MHIYPLFTNTALPVMSSYYRLTFDVTVLAPFQTSLISKGELFGTTFFFELLVEFYIFNKQTSLFMPRHL